MSIDQQIERLQILHSQIENASKDGLVLTLNKPWGGEQSRRGLFRSFPLPDKQSLNYASLMSFSFFMFRKFHYLLFWGLYLALFRKFNFLRKNVIKKPWGGGIKTLPYRNHGMDRQTLKLK